MLPRVEKKNYFRVNRCLLEQVMYQVLPLPHTSIFHSKYCSKFLEDGLITTKLPNVFSSASVSLLQIKAHSRQTRSKVSGTRSKTQEYGSCSSPRDVDTCLFFSATTLAHKQKRTRSQHSYLLLQQNYWWQFYRGTQPGPCSPRCKGKAQKLAITESQNS